MVFRVRALLVSAALIAACGPLATVHAQSVPMPDSATTAAIAQWRADALTLIDPAYRDALAAEYADQSVVDLSTANRIATAKAQAEQAALAELDKSSRALIETYFAEVEASTFVGTPSFTEVND